MAPRLLMIIAAVIALSACSRSDPETPAIRYVVTPLSNGSAVMVDQTSGRSWRLYEMGWIPLGKLGAGASEDDPLGLLGQKK